MAVSGVAMLNGLVLVATIKQLRREGLERGTVVVGGVISDNVLTLLVLPALQAFFGGGDFPGGLRREDGFREAA